MEEAKKNCAYQAVDAHVKSGQVIGLGTGSTAKHVIIAIANKVKTGELKDLTLLATSQQSEDIAKENGLTIVTMDDLLAQGREPVCDVAIDGTDEVDPEFNLVKGRGGALLREKLIETGAKKYIITADETKVVSCLGTGATPVEIIPFCYKTTVERLINLPDLKGKVERYKCAKSRELMKSYGNYIVDLFFKSGKLERAAEISQHIASLVGVVETGFFVNMRPIVMIGKSDGSVVTL
eukprot:Protomagalhaensia_wolfi_Nauph_80__4570@NODE_46_length_4258_cov_300_005452_g37_i0_p1_GENE_NODE_46_length_4258_cov_300_005452_g37_i0NODE_46_length_4258_cov_300_005452_g37_i0_p1_ORF_typecomplete_len237_score57_51Rib_5P_isom_A/PF06026_14/2_1e43DeoRC/PF00455_22/0_0026Sugarbind/PF04198_13/0_0011Rox3/PF08633_10/0_15_NODE_46_length_4258_cov_300_005452_g37_i012581968